MTVFGDKLVRTSGQVLEGKIISEDQISVKIEINGTIFEIQRSEIKDIVRENTPDTILDKARKALSSNDYQGAIKLSIDSLQEQNDLNDVKAVFRDAYAKLKSANESSIKNGYNLDKEIETAKYLISLNDNPSVIIFQGGQEAVNNINATIKATLAEGYFNRAKKSFESGAATNQNFITSDLENALKIAPETSSVHYQSLLALAGIQRSAGNLQDALQNFQKAYDKAPQMSERVRIKSIIDSIRNQNAAIKAAQTPIASPTPRLYFTPIVIFTPTPTPPPTPTPTFMQKAREAGKSGKLLGVVKAVPQKAIEVVKNPNIIKWVLIIAAILIFNWLIPIKLIKMKTSKGDIIAGQYAIWVKRFGLLPLLVFYVVNLTKHGSRKRCPYCNKLLDNIDSYSEMNFFICPHCNENISPIYDLKDYIEHLIKSVQMELSKDKKKASDSVIEKDAMVKLVRAIVTLAYRKRASDIHIEPEMEGVKVRARIDGIIYEILVLPRNIAAATISAIKVMANLDIAERRVPQDGRVNMWIDKSDIDIRLNTSPIPLGERASMRLLDSHAVQVDSTKLGLDSANLERFERSIRKPHGVVLVTGPTGSGKSTTLYVAIQAVNNGEKNIITIEDPIEYHIKGVNQMQVNNAQNFTFSTGLRSILRQDPDIIMVGEIRDMETAEICIDAAMTGHLVFSTLHTIDAPTAFSRLNDLGISPRRYAPSLELVMGQRLFRVNCNECKKPYKPKKEELEILGLTNVSKDTIFIQGAGCEACDKIGFLGRLGIFEILQPDTELKELIEGNATISVIREMARKKGMKTLREEGIVKILQGLTTAEEIIRVTS